MQRLSVTLVLAATAALSPALTAQLTLIAPDGHDVTEGNSNNIFPWGQNTTSTRVLFVYDTTNFTLQGVNAPVVISRLRYRTDADFNRTWSGGSWPTVRIDMSTAVVDYLGTSATYANNHGTDLTTVLNGPVTVQGGSVVAGTPGPWYIDIPLTTPFIYDPSSGSDLVIDIQLTGTGWSGGSAGADTVSGANARCSRVFNTSGSAPVSGTLALNNGLVVQFDLTPVNGLMAILRGSPLRGATPLNVNFTSNAFTSDPGGITSYAWDFDGDTVIDSTLPNPSFIYANCGTFNVSLTITDASHPPYTSTRNAYVVTDDVVPSFTYSLLAPGGVVQFTDTSTPAPTAWAWDFNGDNVTDSTAQHPVWAFGTTCGPRTNVALSVNRLCRGPFSVTRQIVPASSIETVRTGNTSSSANTGNYFDVDVTNPLGVSICSMETKTTLAVNAAVTFNVFVTPNTYVGNHTNMALWRLVGTGNTVGVSGSANLEFVTFAQPIYLPFGRHGVHVQAAAASVQWTSQTTTQTFSNADLTITTGAGGVLGTSATNNRTWNGAFYYSTCATGGEASYGFFARGCGGTAGVSNLVHQNRPVLGTTFRVDVTNAPFAAAIMALGLSRTTSPFGPLPLDMAIFGAPGCTAHVSPDATAFIGGTGTTANSSIVLPAAPSLLCVQFYTQAVVIDPTVNTFGAVLSDAAAGILGN